MCGIWKRDFDSGEQRCNCCTAVFKIAVWTTVFLVENQVFVRKSLILARYFDKNPQNIWNVSQISPIFLFKRKTDFDVTKIPGNRIFQDFFYLKIRKILKTAVYRSFYWCIPVHRCTAVLKQMCGIWKWDVRKKHRYLCAVLCGFVQTSTLVHSDAERGGSKKLKKMCYIGSPLCKQSKTGHF